MDAPTRARALFESGWYCTEAVLQAVAEREGIDSPIIPGIATGLTAGIAHTSNLCGAVSGAILSLGLVMGRQASTDSVEPVFAATQALLAEFEKQHGSTNCRVLTGVDLNTPEGQAEFRASGQGTRCAAFVAAVTQQAIALIDAHRRASDAPDD
jgi:C_GCAxxG_C_C family probable redox protein